jgi:hypothetical protein
MLKKILFAAALALGFTASFSAGNARSLSQRVDIFPNAGACCQSCNCFPGCDCKPMDQSHAPSDSFSP